MTFKDTGFRAFYHNFCVVPITKNTKETIKDFPGADTANGILTYGYYDRQAGLTLEVLAAAHVDGGSANFDEPSTEINSKIRIGAVANDEFMFFADEDGRLAKRYAEKIDMLHTYDANEEVEESRKMTFLDECRHELYIDDVLVYLMKDGLKLEGCWARIVGLGDHFFMATLLNEPDQDFGYHKGEKIVFSAQKTDDDKIVCYSDMNPTYKITAEDLEDGSMLEAAVSKFNKDRNEPNFIDVLELLRDSLVWIPCNAVVSEEDKKRILEIVEKAGDDLDSLKGQEYTTLGKTRLIPDILQNGDKFFFPIFSTVEAMGDYGDNFSKVQKHMLEVINLARNNDKEPAGIVLNAFSEPFVFDKEIWDLVENMKSSISD